MLNKFSQIISLEAKDLVKEQNNQKGYETKKRENWIYRGALDFSLEALKICDLNNKIFTQKEDKQYTKAVVNVTFKYSLEEPSMDTKQLRSKLYREGFILDGKKYVRFKRSGGSSRVGKCLFIRKDLYKKIMTWSYMGLNYEEGEKMDLASMEAYISLTTSSIIDTMKINPKSILLIEDYESVFVDNVMATEWDEEKKKLRTSPKKCKVKNSIWDGQSILDRSIFEENGYGDKGFLLGRKNFFKSACFNGDVQGFFRDNNITDISQLNGITLAEKVEDIKMITTPSSIKFLKMAKDHKKFKVNGKFDKIKAFKYWCENIDDIFGIVKYEKPPHNMHQMVSTHYQLLNTLPLSKKDMRELLGQTLDYIKLLKNDLSVFKYHIGLNYQNCIEKGYDINYENIDFTDSNKLIYDLLMINDDFAKTKLFKKFKDNLLESFKNNMRKGHILVNGNYSVLCGNAYEMLLSSIKKFDGNSIIGINEIHNHAFKYDIDLVGSRSPHVTMGNVWVCKNVECELIDRYFCKSKYIVHVNSINNNLLQTLSGSDFDSDTVLLTDNKVLVESAKKIYGKFLVPTDFTPKKKVERTNSVEDKIDLDIKTSKNLIGEIINLSQILNSEYWDRKSKGEDVEGLYELICQLDVMSCIEIDKAKKESVVDATKELKRIRESKWISFGEISRNKEKKTVMCRPYFFKYVGVGKDYKFVKKNTPMDFLQQIIDEEIPRKEKNESDINFLDLIVNKNVGAFNTRKANIIMDNISRLNEEIKILWSLDMSNEERYRFIKNKKENIIKQISKIKVDNKTILILLKRINKEGKDKYNNLKKSSLLLLNIIYNTHKKEFISVFKNKKSKTEILKEDIRNVKNISIYDKWFKKMFKNA